MYSQYELNNSRNNKVNILFIHAFNRLQCLCIAGTEMKEKRSFNYFQSNIIGK